MAILKMTASIDIEYRAGKGVSGADLTRQLDWAMAHLAAEGLLTGELDATVETHNVRIAGETSYAVGDIVSMEKWDKTEPPHKRMGRCEVTAVAYGQKCESGVMVQVVSPRGEHRTLDSHWLVPVRDIR